MYFYLQLSLLRGSKGRQHPKLPLATLTVKNWGEEGKKKLNRTYIIYNNHTEDLSLDFGASLLGVSTIVPSGKGLMTRPLCVEPVLYTQWLPSIFPRQKL